MSQSDPTLFESEVEEAFAEDTSLSSADVEAAGGDDPTGDALQGASSAALSIDQAAALPGVPVALRPVSGRYRGTFGAFQLELRVDVDRVRTMKRLSGDFFQITGGTTRHVGSFVVNSLTATATPTHLVLTGLGAFTFATAAPKLRVSIPRRTVLQPQAPATVQFQTVGGTAGATYTCAFESSYFRTVRIETDVVSDVASAFVSYSTGSLPSGGSARPLSVVKAFAEAGIEVIPTAANNTIDISVAGLGAKWSNAELHAAMVRHFSLWRDVEQWSVWALNAKLHDLGSGLLGIMFDQHGKQRQGCAMFYEGLSGTTAEQRRLQLFTTVHELAHCFNLLHSWQKSLGTPPAPNRPKSLSWMNYPWIYPDGGPAVFWNKFAFQFDNEEVIHLRHAYRKNIIMGGSDFAVGSALQAEALEEPLRDESGLVFSISTHQRSFALGEPVVLQLSLGSTHPRGRRAHAWLHPNCGLVKVVIRKPSGEVTTYEPLLDHLVGEKEQTLYPNDAIKDSAYIGFGKDGFYFDQPGNYRVRAVYAALDGSEVMSEVITVRVRYPVTATDETLADLFMGEDQGALLYLLGSDSEDLKRGNDAFSEVLNRHANHPLASYARLVRGVNLNRTFKTVDESASTRVRVRAPQAQEASSLLSAVVQANVLDPVSAEMTMEHLADAQVTTGDAAAAAHTRSALAAKSNGGRKPKQPSASA